MNGDHNNHILVASGALVIAFSILFSFTVLGHRDQMLELAGVGASVAVEQTELNTLTNQIHEKERELERREQDVLVQEKKIQTRFVETRDQTALVYTTLVGLLLLALILLNFLLDARRRKGPSEIEKTVGFPEVYNNNVEV